MFDDLLIHPRTLRQLEEFAGRPSHGLALTGPEGAGKRTLALAMAANLLKITPAKLNSYPYITIIDPPEPVIGIDVIRSVQRLLQLKTPRDKSRDIQRIIVVIDATKMRQEAQNSFLKSLEEPPADTCIIFTCEINGGLLPTIFSRLQRVDVLPVTETLAKNYYGTKGIPSTELAKNYALSQGQVGLLASLLDSEAKHPLKDWVEAAKQILGKPAGERILQTEELSKDKTQVLLLLNALGRIVHAALMHAGKSGNQAAVKRWHNSLEAVQFARDAMSRNANTKLLLDNLLLSI